MARDSLLKRFAVVSRVRRLKMFVSIGMFVVFYTIASVFLKPRAGRVLFASDATETPVGNLAAVLNELRARNIPGVAVTVMCRRSLWTWRGPVASIRLAIAARSASAIVIDDYFPELYAVTLHPDTEFIQLWHASGAFKKVGFAREGLPGGPRKGSTAHRGYTAAIVSAEGVRDAYATAFNMSAENVVATGIPKTDLLFDRDWVAQSRASVRRELGIPQDARVTLVATTFHGHGQPTATVGGSHIDWSKVAEGLPSEYLLIKNHPFTRGIAPSYPPHARVVDVTSRNDIDALMCSSDVVVTDFSSVIFDAAMLKKPVVYLFANTDDYEANRGFFFEASSYVWGPTASTEPELVSAIKAPTQKSSVLDAAYARHLSACDGKSTKRVVDSLVVPALRLRSA